MNVESAERDSSDTPQTTEIRCGLCQVDASECFYTVAPLTLCPECRIRFEEQWRGGSKLGRFLKASLFGLGAGILGSVIYFAVAELTGIIFGLIAILVGFMVGRAVRAGSGGRGGLGYQFLAVSLTYASIASTHIPEIVKILNERTAERPDGDAPKENAKDADAAKDQAKAKDAKPEPPAPRPRVGIGEMLATLVVLPLLLMVFALSMPVLVATQSPMMGFILLFGLMEAWRVNRPFRLVFEGPFRVESSGSSDESAPDEIA